MNEFIKLKTFLIRYGIEPGCKISQRMLDIMILSATLGYGKEFAVLVMDCFSPAGENVNKYPDDYEYWFDYESWDELRYEDVRVN